MNEQSERNVGRHVVFGSGQIGAALARTLLAQGQAVTVVSRRGEGAPEGARVERGDAMDATFAARAAAGAAVVYHAMNAPYSAARWAAVLPGLQANLIAAAGRAGARLVVLENLYMLGRPRGEPLTERSPVAPVGPKGELRARLSDALFEAHARGEVQATSGRASHFVGPEVVQSQLGEPLLRPLAQGRTAWIFGRPEARHSFSFAPDVARGLAVLGASELASGRPWNLPVVTASLGEMAARLAARLGQGGRVRRLPDAFMPLVGLFVPEVREMIELRHEWNDDYVVSAEDARTRLGLGATGLDEIIEATARWAQGRWGSAQALTALPGALARP